MGLLFDQPGHYLAENGEGHWQNFSPYWRFCLSICSVERRKLRTVMPTLIPSPVTAIAAADPVTALDHFEKLLAFETDCWDVHAALAAGQQDFVLLDVRSPEDLSAGGPAPSICHIAES